MIDLEHHYFSTRNYTKAIRYYVSLDKKPTTTMKQSLKCSNIHLNVNKHLDPICWKYREQRELVQLNHKNGASKIPAVERYITNGPVSSTNCKEG